MSPDSDDIYWRRANQTSQQLGPTALESAAGTGSLKLVELLLDRGAELSPPADYEGDSALARACMREDLALVRLLLDRAASPNPVNPRSASPLSRAAAMGDLSVILLLRAAGAEVSIGAKNQNPLTAAAMNGRLDVVEYLLGLEKRESVFKDAIEKAEKALDGCHAEVVSRLKRFLEEQHPRKWSRMEKVS
ncbi:ankyrin repeat-containing domain protein [Lasiosphaeris hirsuta]|uniref:Ankyrin repeat-containing domain protein n=1 Tax=Lasiosphaeris hirsuta TaxID=260670 RepID=A0AA40AAF9_9PEZI|nr:ankyrin repeat-containing domain protein [Lasiosphaeris hirsuta]